MFRVTFDDFRCWKHLVIEAPVGCITLIKGNSGVGKTTIVQGITWCLYGNMRLVTPNHIDKAKTRVMIECPYTLDGINGTLTIERQKNPNRFIVSHEESKKLYEDKVAQSIVDELFGNYDIWVASCYIGQGCRNSFLTATNIGKMDLLNSISFHEEDPNSYIERIDSAIAETDTNYKSRLSMFTNNVNSLQSILSTTDISKALTLEQIEGMNTKIDTLRNEQINLQIQKNQRDVNLGILVKLRQQLSEVRNKNITVPKADESLLAYKYYFKYDDCNEIESMIAKIIEVVPLLRRRDQLESEIERLKSILVKYPKLRIEDSNCEINYTMFDYHEAVSKEVAFRDNQKLAQLLGVFYSEDAIKEKIDKNRSILAAQERLKLEQERNILQSRIEKIEMEQLTQTIPLKYDDLAESKPIPVPDYSKYSTKRLAEKITELSEKHGSLQANIIHLQKGKDVIQCPQCKESLRYQQGALVRAETGPANIDELNAAQREMATIGEEILRVNRKIQSLLDSEAAERSEYELAVTIEQKRLDYLHERNKQLELDKQRRDIENKSRSDQLKHLKTELTKISDTISSLPEIKSENRKLLSNIEIQQTNTLIGRLCSISIIDPPKVSSQDIQSYINYQDILQKNAVALLAHKEYVETIPSAFRNETVRNISTFLDKLRTHLTIIKETSAERIRLDILKTSLEGQIQAVTDTIGPDVTSSIDRINLELSELTQSLALSVKAHQAIQYHAQITMEREEIIKLNNTIGDMQTLRQHAIDTECRILQEVVDSINTSIQGVCGTLFDRDVNITLSLFKTLKTTKNVKPVANFTISYQGGNFDNINQMSGGEGDRASLALTLALNRLSSCPLLMLDESLASLDLNMKEAAIRTIRENTNNTVFIIMHDGIEGIYDFTIDLNEITQGRY